MSLFSLSLSAAKASAICLRLRLRAEAEAEAECMRMRTMSLSVSAAARGGAAGLKLPAASKPSKARSCAVRGEQLLVAAAVEAEERKGLGID